MSDAVLMGGRALAHDCTLCDAKRKAIYVLWDWLTDTVLYVCQKHHESHSKLKGFVHRTSDPIDYGGLFGG